MVCKQILECASDSQRRKRERERETYRWLFDDGGGTGSLHGLLLLGRSNFRHLVGFGGFFFAVDSSRRVLTEKT